MKEALALGEFAEAQIEQAGAMAIDQYDAEAGKGSQQMSEGLEMKVTIDKKLGTAELRRQIILAPEILRRASEDRLGMCAIASQVLGQAENPVEIGARGFTLAITLQGAQSFTREVFGDDRFLFVSFVAGRRGLKVETESAGALIFKLS